MSSLALTTQIAPWLAARAIGFVPTGTEASTVPDASSSLTELAGTDADALGGLDHRQPGATGKDRHGGRDDRQGGESPALALTEMGSVAA